MYAQLSVMDALGFLHGRPRSIVRWGSIVQKMCPCLMMRAAHSCL
jgi:hypothetical protein